MDEHLYKEVYVVGTDSTVASSGELVVCASFEGLLEFLRTKNVSINTDLRVLHGVLTSAVTIPKDLKDKQAFLLLNNKISEDTGILRDADVDDDFNELGSEIERVLDDNEITDFFFEIDDIYILYGYEMSLALSVDEDEIDEEIIKSCLLISEEAKKLTSKRD